MVGVDFPSDVTDAETASKDVAITIFFTKSAKSMEVIISQLKKPEGEIHCKAAKKGWDET